MMRRCRPERASLPGYRVEQKGTTTQRPTSSFLSLLHPQICCEMSLCISVSISEICYCHHYHHRYRHHQHHQRHHHHHTTSSTIIITISSSQSPSK
ncbi:hypothetical protein I79_024659 [Cricetulus griseus]|uniref:Uncharacterized protein n=1 Tax=Cricetulus griseus TaxID=10029 RepID=G3IL96_CRIGR|nr:hypothetical protein I79_024659 [Cricetulus griseus]